MEINLKPVVLFIGNYGSGKTEVAVNFAVNRSGSGVTVQVGDLDLVNPYFRCREVKEMLQAKGIEVLVPEENLLNADLPILIPQIQGAIKKPKGLLILDVGGDDVGATVLGSLEMDNVGVDCDMLMVVNSRRPFTETTEGCISIAREIEAAGKFRITGIVGNTHLMDMTDAEIVLEGYHYARDVASRMNIPLVFITCETRLLDELDMNIIDCPVLPITRHMLPPWRRRQELGSQNFLLS